jgi:hypothetical protein
MKSHVTPFLRAKRHALRAMARGDLRTATDWTALMMVQLNAARSVEDLRKHGPIPKLKPGRRSKPATPADDVPRNPIPESMARQLAGIEARRHAARLEKLGVKLRTPHAR